MADGRITLQTFGGAGNPATPQSGFSTLWFDSVEWKYILDDGTIKTLEGPQGPTGPAGADGAPGSVWYNGSGAPGSGLGVVGDYYLDNDAPNNYYTKTGAATWTLLGTLKGAQGDPGPAGGALAQKSVADILNPTELAGESGASDGDPIVAYQTVAGGINRYGFYFWDSDPDASENIPYRVDGTGGQWALNYGWAFDRLYGAQVQTGILEGLAVSVNGGDNTQFDVTAGEAEFTDAHSDALNPTKKRVTYSAQTGVAVTNLATHEFTYLTVDDSGAINQLTSPPTQEQLRDTPLIGVLVHFSNTQIDSVSQRREYVATPGHDVSDLARALGPINISGNVYGPGGADLTLDKSVGESYALGHNAVNPKTPSISVDPAESGLSFARLYRDGSGGFTVESGQTTYDPGEYDDGTGTPGSVGNNQWSNKRIYYLPDTGDHIIALGQDTYGSRSAALDALATEALVLPTVLNGFLFRCWITARGNASDGTNDNQVVFTSAGKFGGGSVSQGVDNDTDLQQAYSNTADGKVTTDATRGSLKVQEGAGVGGNLLELLDDSSVNQGTIDATGAITGTVVASQAQAEGGTENARVMSPLRNQQAHANRIATTVTGITDGSPVVGTSNLWAPADHQHDHNNLGGGALHALAVSGGAAGFMSGADKEKLDGLSNGGFAPATQQLLYDDFLSGNEDTDEFGALGWRISKTGTGNVFTMIDAETGHPGIVRISGGSAAGARSCGHLGQSTTGQNMVLGSGAITFEAVVRFNGTTSNQEVVMAGLGDIQTSVGENTNGVYIEFLAADTNWHLVCNNGGSKTRVDLGVAADTTWRRLGFVVNAAASSVQGYVDGVLTGSAITTNIPTAAISPMFKADGNGTSADTTDFDYFYLSQALSR